MSRRDRSGMPTGVLIVLVTIAAVLCIALCTLMYLDNRGLLGSDETGEEKITQTQAKSYKQEEVKEETNVFDDLLPEDKSVDIAGLRDSVNPDIYAWLYIPDTGIDEPIVQHPEDIAYYSEHNYEGAPDENGALYTQLFNSKDFKDNLTVVYGHNGGNDKGFSKLNLFADPDFFKTHRYIYVYTDGAILLYQTFAAYETDDKLIVMFYGTSDDDMYNIYIQRLEEIAGISSNIDKEAWPQFTDKILTLSTGVLSKDDRRFVVQAKFLGGFIEEEGNE